MASRSFASDLGGFGAADRRSPRAEGVTELRLRPRRVLWPETGEERARRNNEGLAGAAAICKCPATVTPPGRRFSIVARQGDDSDGSGLWVTPGTQMVPA